MNPIRATLLVAAALMTGCADAPTDPTSASHDVDTGDAAGPPADDVFPRSDPESSPAPSPLAAPAPPLTVTTTLSREAAPVGAVVYASCAVADAAEVAWPLPTTVTVPEGVRAVGPALQVEAAGSFTVGCRLADASLPASHVDATLVGTPAPPVSLDVAVAPVQATWAVGEHVTLTWTARDTAGAPVALDDDAVVVRVWPEHAATTADGATWTLVASGVVAFDGSLAAAPDVAGGVALVVDEGAPTVTLTSPPLPHRTDAAEVSVAGRASDVAGLAGVTVDDANVSLGASGAFAVPVGSGLGLNSVRVAATDVLDQTREVFASWLYSPLWHPAGDAAQPVAGQVVVRLGPDALNADPPALRDFARLAAALPGFSGRLDSPDIGPSSYEAPQLDRCGTNPRWWAQVTSGRLELKVAGATVTDGADPVLTPRPGGFDVTWSPTVRVALEARLRTVYSRRPTLSGRIGNDPWICIPMLWWDNLNQSVDLLPPASSPLIASPYLRGVAQVQLAATIEVAKDANTPLAFDQELDVDVTWQGVETSLTAATLVRVARSEWLERIDNVTETYDVDVLAPLGSLVPGFAVNGPRALLDFASVRSGLIDQLRTVWWERAAGLVAALESPAATREAAIGPADVPVAVTTALDTVAVDSSGVELTFTGVAAVTPAPGRAGELGSLGRAGCLAGDEPSADGPGSAAFVHVDHLNQAVHAAWLGTSWPVAASDEQLTALTPEDLNLTRAELWADLPPILSDCPPAVGLELHAGDVVVAVALTDAGGEEREVILVGAFETAATLVEGDPAKATFAPIAWRYLAPLTDDSSAPLAAAEAVATGLAMELIVDGLVSDALRLTPQPALDLAAAQSVPVRCEAADDCTPPTGSCLVSAGCVHGMCRYAADPSPACSLWSE